MRSTYFHRALPILGALLGGLLLVGAHPAFAQTASAKIQVSINPQQRFQMIDGFGVNFNGTYFRDAQKPMIDMLIDDLGATIFRLDPYGLTNWEAVNDNKDPNVMDWEYYNDRYSIPTFKASWAAARYLNSRGIRPFLTLSGIAPDWMLDDKASPPQHKVCHQGTPAKPAHLSPAMYGEFAEEIVSMLIYTRTKARLDFEYFSPVNETDCYPAEGPRVDPDEMPKALDAIAQRMKEEGLGDIKLVVADQAMVTNNYIGPILQDDDLMKQVAVFSFHTYGADSVGPQVQRIRQSKYPETRVWLTEYGDLNDLDKSQENEWENFSLAATERALRALNQGAMAALYWDAYDNYHEHYPRLTFYGLMKNADHIYSPKKRYYAAKQLYHFVRPGSQRIAAESSSPNLMISAFRNGTNGELILVGAKRGGSHHVRVELPGAHSLPAAWDLYETTPQIDCLKVDTVPVSKGAAEFDLPDEAIFTLVGKVKE
jgi:O-glycosyl hydrolase